MPTIGFDRHLLRVRDPNKSLAFYCNVLGMQHVNTIVETEHPNVTLRHLVGFQPVDTDVSPLVIELIHTEHGNSSLGTTTTSGYWKIGICVSDVDAAREYLVRCGVTVSEPAQFLDIGYLCHFTDPDGYVIELLQRTFGKCAEQETSGAKTALDEHPVIGQITLRIRDAETSLRYYQDGLGMRLLSRQEVEPYGFTLYFLAFTDELPPDPNIDAVTNREWLWQRPYTTLELQHRWPDQNAEPAYDVSDAVGYCGVAINARDSDDLISKLLKIGGQSIDGPSAGRSRRTLTRCVSDPDGHPLWIVDQSTMRQTRLNEK